MLWRIQKSATLAAAGALIGGLICAFIWPLTLVEFVSIAGAGAAIGGSFEWVPA